MEQKDQSASADALEKPSDDQAANPATATAELPNLAGDSGDKKPPKKVSGFKKLMKRFNLWLLLFVFIIVIAGVIVIVSYLNSKKAPVVPSIATQEIDQDTLKQLANTDVTVGGSGQTLTVQGNAVFSGQVLTKADVGIAGTLVVNSVKVGTDLTTTQITVAGKSNLNDVQANTLQVGSSTTLQGVVTLQKDLNVAGTSTFSGPMTASQITVTRLIMSGNASLQVPNHIAFTGASPTRSITNAVLGAGGSASVSGSDTAGSININSGSNTSPGCFATLTFNQRFTSQPRVIVSPVGNAAGQTQYYVDRSVTGFSICTANAAPPNQVFGFDYFVVQ
jgi:flagellar basal body-associated protein FliL